MNTCLLHLFATSNDFRAYFKKAGYVWGMARKGHILINLGQFEDETPLNIMQI